ARPPRRGRAARRRRHRRDLLPARRARRRLLQSPGSRGDHARAGRPRPGAHDRRAGGAGRRRARRERLLSPRRGLPVGGTARRRVGMTAAGEPRAAVVPPRPLDPTWYDYTPSPIGRTVAGAERLLEVGPLVEELGRRRALVVTSPALVAEGRLLERLERSLGKRLAGVFAETRPHSPIEVVRAALALAREVRADCLVSLGGGSSIDTAKGIVWYAETEAPELGPQPLAHVAIPSTLSGAEYTVDAGITIGVTKRVHAHPKIVPAIVVLDPAVAASAPPELFLASGLNALAHCLEGTVSINRSPMTDASYLHAIRLLSEALPDVQAGDAAARGTAQAAAALAAIPSREMGLAHALVHAVGGRFRTPHAATHAIN